ncbi:phosphate ABC transporter permease PstA [Microbacterium fluvii]|uniref:Phosphate transport system permease protein PstA n=1 Tax=Microbacterium fluvii TaxID=415215 RepID=A0ABW2HGI0_9MICO|nr:phosphate ABC transporter permease PstA [Microbacterium fluvii]MCU4672512.1 phosphate ABC transporter permease PstA [Microbacterium fluvii]
MTVVDDALRAPAGTGAPVSEPRTVLPARAPASDPPRRQTGGVRAADLLAIGGAAMSAVSLTVFLFMIAPLEGPIAFAAIAYVLFVAAYVLIVALDEPGPVVADRLIAVVIHSLAFTVLATLVFVVGFTLARGAEALTYSNFYVEDMSLAGPLDPLSAGGIVHAIAGTLIQISIALVITIPLGLTTALFLTEVPGRFSRFVRTIVESMTALPSIVAGLFVYASFILVLGVQKSGLAAALAISVMMLPIMIRSADVVLRLVPATLKEASIGLGAGQWHTVWHVTLPTAKSGLTTAVILATARGIGETSPVLLTSGFTAALNLDPTADPMVSLPLAVFEFVKSPEPSMVARGFGTAAVLMLLVLILFVVARMIGRDDVAARARRAARWARARRAIGAVPRRVHDALAPLRRLLARSAAPAGAWLADRARAGHLRLLALSDRLLAGYRTLPLDDPASAGSPEIAELDRAFSPRTEDDRPCDD